MKNKFFILLALILLIPAFSVIVSAADPAPADARQSVFTSIGSAQAIERLYDKYDTFIDACLYLIIFLGLAQVSLKKLFRDKAGGRAVTIGVALILSIGLALFERHGPEMHLGSCCHRNPPGPKILPLLLLPPSNIFWEYWYLPMVERLLKSPFP